MKITLPGGIVAEGSPQEIMEYQRLQAEQTRTYKTLPSVPTSPTIPQWNQPWWGIYPPKIMCGSVTWTGGDYQMNN